MARVVSRTPVAASTSHGLCRSCLDRQLASLPSRPAAPATSGVRVAASA